jgi:phenylacetic acid degradation operon negative regulatory protein
MQPPAGPSLQLILLLSELGFDLTAKGVTQAWQWWSGSARGARKLCQLEQRGLISIERAATERIVRLTEFGHSEALGGRDPARQWSRAWDGRWRVVLFDVPEHHGGMRAKLRRALRSLSFGYLQNSVWISPDSTDALRTRLAGATLAVETLTLLDAHPCGGESNQDLVQGAWDFQRINRGYEAYCDFIQRRPAQRSHAVSRAAWTRWLDREWQAWKRAVRSDPLLPDALLPADYRGKEAFALRMKTLRDLSMAKVKLGSG